MLKHVAAQYQVRGICSPYSGGVEVTNHFFQVTHGIRQKRDEWVKPALDLYPPFDKFADRVDAILWWGGAWLVER